MQLEELVTPSLRQTDTLFLAPLVRCHHGDSAVLCLCFYQDRLASAYSRSTLFHGCYLCLSFVVVLDYFLLFVSHPELIRGFDGVSSSLPSTGHLQTVGRSIYTRPLRGMSACLLMLPSDGASTRGLISYYGGGKKGEGVCVKRVGGSA